MEPFVFIILAMLILGVVPIFIVAGIAAKGVCETRRERGQNEKEIAALAEKIYGAKGRDKHYGT